MSEQNPKRARLSCFSFCVLWHKKEGPKPLQSEHSSRSLWDEATEGAVDHELDSRDHAAVAEGEAPVGAGCQRCVGGVDCSVAPGHTRQVVDVVVVVVVVTATSTRLAPTESRE